MVSCKALLIALAFGVEALAGSNPKPTCATKLGTTSVKYVKSQTSTKTQTVTQTKVVYKKEGKTITPKPTTVTVFSTKFKTTTKTAKQNTDTATTTIIVDTSTVTDTLTITHEETKTDTTTITSTSTSTIPTPDGFTPVASQLAALKTAAIPRAVNVRAPAILEERKTSKAMSVKCDKNGKPVPNTPQYPQAVNCVQTISKTILKTSTSTIKGYPVTLARPTKVSTATVTKTVTQTKVPANAKTTITKSSTLTVTTTIQTDITNTITTTSTVETVVPTTVNGACLDSNLVAKDNNGRWAIGMSIGGSVPFLTVLTAGNAYECCVACQNAQFCTGSVWLVSTCFASIDNVCRPGEAVTSFWLTSESGDGSILVSNGPCGNLTPA